MTATLLPYPGLRSFLEDEADIFFGREEQTDQLLQKLGKNKFLAIVGPSGCGKSSLARAGMISALKTGFMAPAGVHWRIAVMRPGGHPFKSLAEALMAESALGLKRAQEAEGVSFLESTLLRGPLGLVEVLRQTPIPEGTNLLILVDQFEEIFRFRTLDNRDEQDAFVELLLETSGQQECQVYIVITMRSDYLGDCALFAGLPEALNESQYLTPRMTREQREEAIVGPARVFCGDVESALVNRLLNESGPDPNQLPVLQHVLMRMWSCTATREECLQSNVFLEDVPRENLGHVLTLDDYKTVGGLTEALSRHADEAFNELSDEQKRIAELLFRTLCEGGTERRDGRLPATVREAAIRAGTEPDQIINIVEVFRRPGYGFLSPPVPEKIDEDTPLDITHESLIRLWKRLSEWVDREAKSAKRYRFLYETACQWKAGEGALWGTPNLEIALAWRKSETLPPAWAERYGGDFDLAMEFLDESQKRRTRQITVRRSIYVVIAVCLMILAGVILGYWDSYIRDHVTYYGTFTRRFGAPVGIGELASDQVKGRAVSYMFKQKGTRNKPYEIRAVNSRFEPTDRHQIGTYFEYGDEIKRPVRECIWRFVVRKVSRTEEEVVYEKAYDKTDNLVFSLVYLPRTDRMNIRAHFVGPGGFPRLFTKSSAEYIAFKYSPEGNEIQLCYFDRRGKPQRGLDYAYCQQKDYNYKGLLIAVRSLGLDGRLMLAKQGYAVTKFEYDDRGNVVREAYFGTDEKPIESKDGYVGRGMEYDDKGNMTRETYFGTDEKPVPGPKRYSAAKLQYDDRGNVVRETYLGTDDKPTEGIDGCAGRGMEYDEKGNMTRVACLGKDEGPMVGRSEYAFTMFSYDDQGRMARVAYLGRDEKPVKMKSGYAVARFNYDDRGNMTGVAYFGEDEKPVVTRYGHAGRRMEYDDRGNMTSVGWFGKNGEPIPNNEGYAFSRLEYDERGNVVRETYFGTDDKPISGKRGYASRKMEYDDQGNKIHETHFDINRKPILTD